jgi:hypothetical protein
VRVAGGEDDGCQDGTGTRKEVGTRVGERARTVAETRMGDGTGRWGKNEEGADRDQDGASPIGVNLSQKYLNNRR